MNERIRKMAEEAGFSQGGVRSWSVQFEAFARLVAEDCAKTCQDLPSTDPDGPWFNDDMTAGAMECEQAICARYKGD